MVKPDAKQDYYADLELPATADAEDVKRQFRHLAKQYHPDRNPGREAEVLAKFQAVQAAHEILSDASLKTKYDQDRAKINRVSNAFAPADTDPYNFRKPATRPGPPPAPFPPPPRRTQTTKDFGSGPTPRFSNPNTKNPGSAAPGVDKFTAFTKAAPQQWDRAKYEEAARADAARGFRSMKSGRPLSGQFPGQQPMPPPPPPQPARPPRAPTAPKTNAFDSTSSNDDQVPQGPGFPGMSRTANMRRAGFDPSSPSPGMDEQQAPNRASAYASYNRGERPNAANPQGYFPEGVSHHSPPMASKKPAVSPLRHVRSESEWNAPKAQRPDFERVSSRYANTPGEKTNLNGGLGRSASVRTSPVESPWNGPPGPHQSSRPYSHHGQPRNHSSSPRLRPSAPPFVEDSSSSSESSGDGRAGFGPRPKAKPRRPRVHTASSQQHGPRPFSDDDPALTGQFSNHNYTRVVEDDSGNTNSTQYHYPPPNDSPVRRPFSNMTSPEQAHARMSQNGHGPDPDVGIPKYDTPRSVSNPMNIENSARARNPTQTGATRRSPTSWQVPSSVMPAVIPPPKCYRMDSIPEERTSTLRGWLSDPPTVSEFELYRKSWKADKTFLSSHQRPPPEHVYPAGHRSNPQSVSEEHINSKFTAADWEGKFGSGDEFLRPNTDTSDRERRSPTRSARPRARSTGRTKSSSQDHVRESVPPVPGTDTSDQHNAANDVGVAQRGPDGSFHPVDAQELPKSAAFQPGTFSADEWAERFKEQTWTTPSTGLRNTKGPRKQSKSLPRKETTTTFVGEKSPPNPTSSGTILDDAMDIDKEPLDHASPKATVEPGNHAHGSSATHSAANGNLNVDLGDLKHTAPLAPSATGLKDLHDLSNAIPFESRAAPSVEPSLNRTISSTARRLDLPKPPKTIIPPAEDSLTQEAWETYVHNIKNYLHDWNVFNIKMLDHFRTRQDQINVGMRNNWISSVGDGPSVEAFDAATAGAAGDAGLRAGFATYMAWLEDDARCRSWWDAANERHRECFENLARVRETVKKAAGVV